MNPLVIHALRQCYYVSKCLLFAKKYNFSRNFLRDDSPVGGNAVVQEGKIRFWLVEASADLQGY